MYIQIFNSIKNILIQIIFTLQDGYIWSCEKLRTIFVQILYATYFITRSPPKSSILYAYCNDIDVTLIIKYFYYLDETLSVASMQRWLNKFKIKASKITIVFTNVVLNTTYVNTSQIDLNDEVELLTGKDIRSGDVSLNEISSKNCIILHNELSKKRF